MSVALSKELSQRIDKARKASRFAGVGTLFGAALILGSFVYGSSQLRSIRENLANERGVLAATQLQTQTAKEELANIQGQLDEKKRELAEKAEQLDAARGDKQALDKFVGRLPTSAVADIPTSLNELLRIGAIPKVTAVKATLEPNERQLYDFKLWIDFRPVLRDRLKSEIKEVVYWFDHPSFARKDIVSTDAERGYPVSYRGWGALRDVIIEYKLKNGESIKTDFYMHAELNSNSAADGQSISPKGIPHKRIPSKGDEVPLK